MGEDDAVVQFGPGVRRLRAPNPSPMTLDGTNTYLLGERRIGVIDPGPDDTAHLDAILQAIGDGEVSHILVTHAHVDHSPLARRLASLTGAPVLAFGPATAGRRPVMERLARAGHAGGGEGIDAQFAPDVTLADGDTVTGDEWQLRALHTPGHLSNHMCFAKGGTVFTGDHVMGWASSLVSPPDGDLTAFMASCAKLRDVPAETYLPGHGSPVERPLHRLEWLISHRQGREAEILSALSEGADTARDLATAIYTDTPAALLPAATRNVFAHLINLSERACVVHTGDLSADAVFSLKK